MDYHVIQDKDSKRYWRANSDPLQKGQWVEDISEATKYREDDPGLDYASMWAMVKSVRLDFETAVTHIAEGKTTERFDED